MKSTILFILLAFAGSVSAQLQKTIKATAPITVTAEEGTAPLLPYRLWTTYTDGTSEFRQVKWDLDDTETETSLTQKKAGERYTLHGIITGDGRSVEARVTVAGGKSAVNRTPVARPLPLKDVQLTGNNYLTEARDLDIRHLLSLDVSQQLYNYRDTYGLPTDGYTESDGWDSPTTKLKGHGTGHYLSALALAYASCTDKGLRAQLLSRIRRMVDEMRQCQERTFVFDKALGRYREARDLAPEGELEQLGGTWEDFDRYKQDYSHYGYGYLNAIPAQHCALIECYRPYNNESGVWAPYYTVHKQLSGLIDIATLVDNKAVARKALLIAKDMGLWVWNRLHYRTFVRANGTLAERRNKPGNRYEMWNMYIAGEVGGMSESLARLSELATDKSDKERLLEAATYFDSPAFFEPLKKNVDAIRGRHANQHIPMVVGSVEVFKAGGDQSYLDLARAFWHHIQGRYRYAMGGVGNGEMFREPYTQMLCLATNTGGDPFGNVWPEGTINETCCAYNLAKLTRELNGFTPNDAALMDYHERVLYNQIIGSLRHSDYATTYQYAVGLNTSKPWGNDTPQSTCCGGTGAENHVRYQEAAYWEGGDTLWAALYMPTVAQWRGVTIEQQCPWPADATTLTIAKGKGRFALKLRVPYWATEGFTVKLNGEEVKAKAIPGSYMEIACRNWKQGDKVEIEMPFGIHVDYTPDKLVTAATGKNQPNTPLPPAWTGAVMNGPLVMAATDITSYDEAIVSPDAKAVSMSATEVQLGNHKLIPDYLTDEGATRYMRFPIGEGAAIDSAEIAKQMATARQRIAQQHSWETTLPHVPAFAPWAPNGFARLVAAFEKGDAQALAVALATMRPGNLAEPEDLAPLLPLLDRAQRRDANSEEVKYAQMVMRYVTDGSGTKDMIEKAIKKLKK